MPQVKLKNYFGLAKRAGELIFGIDNIKKSKKRMYLIVVCSTASEKVKAFIDDFSVKENIIVRKLQKSSIDENINTQNCKVVALTKESFIEPILKGEE